MEEFWSSPGGLVCVSRDLTMSLLVLSYLSNSIGAGCYGTDVSEASSISLPPRLLYFREFWSKTLHGRFPSGGITSLSGRGFVLSPPSGVVETVGGAPEGARLIASGPSTEVVETVLQSRAPSTRKLSLKWHVHFLVQKLSAAPN